MNKLLERKQSKIEYQQQPLQDNMMNCNAYYEPNYNNAYQNNQVYNTQYAMNSGYVYQQQPQQQYGVQNQYNNQYYGNVQPVQNMPNENYEYIQEQRAYVRPTEQYNVKVADKKNKKKARLNTKAKLLIGVYFFIVAVIATLLLVNMAAGTTTVSADGDDFLAINEDAINYYVNADGEVIELSGSDTMVNYDYDVDNSWFDDMCDGITNKAGK